GKDIKEWEEWYIKKYPDALSIAAIKITEMIKNLKDSIIKINKEIINEWLKDLVIVKTFIGLKFQEAILKKGAEIVKKNYRLSNPSEESKGIDGFIGGIPVSIKPITYKAKKGLNEEINAVIVYYEKLKDGIEIDFSELVKKE
ncbi:restriction endonuclease, partial [Candidatus Roizmanbacteria bacterium CG_4_9_14_0_8_um_filter_34_12]